MFICSLISAEAVFQQYQDGPNYGFYPLCMDDKGMMFLAKDKISPKFLCTMFHCPRLAFFTLQIKSYVMLILIPYS